MKNILLLFFFVSTLLFAQNYKITEDVRTHKPMLVGSATRAVFNDSNFVDWFTSQYSNYKVDTNTAKKAEIKLTDKNIKIVMGTWCSDSRREVPRMLKILDTIGFPQDSLSLIFVDRKKKGIGNETDSLNIELVPTFIIYKNKKELGRIIETPEETLEKDLLKIVE